jgi:hypothetical protein
MNTKFGIFAMQRRWKKAVLETVCPNLLSNDHNHCVKQVHEFIPTEVKAILSW